MIFFIFEDLNPKHFNQMKPHNYFQKISCKQCLKLILTLKKTLTNKFLAISPMEEILSFP